MHIVILDGYTCNPGSLSWEKLSSLGDFTCYDRTPASLVIERALPADLLLVNKVPLTREIIMALPNLKYIGVLATGYNVVDLAAAAERGIPVTNIPEYGTDAVAQYTLALILELASRVGMHSTAVKNGEWLTSADFCFWKAPMTELKGKTLGIIGYGRIGKSVGKLAEAFGMKLLIHSRSYAGSVSLDALCAESDIVTLHCPLTETNRRLFNAERISSMKKGAWLINTARGPLIDEQALADALISGQLGGAALDVADVEPPKTRSPLWDIDSCIVTPHVAWAPNEARQRLMDIAGDNVRAWLDGHVVNCVNNVY